uniref:Nucleoporin p58/p45 n=1 Tax=Trichobilharzia regenti TaxID=157069 RepID=A0AA85JS13_TRIRE|nr:unnamed protein product [Trichobilharzia regenti]
MNRGLSDPNAKNHIQAKDSVLCNEISTSLSEFKKYLAEQKKHREELSALSYDHLINLRDELKSLHQLVSSSISGLRHTATAISRLKTDVLKEEKNAEIAHKTSDHGLSGKGDSSEISSYFMKKISDFDTRIRLYKKELEVFEENVYSQQLNPLTPRDLLNVLQRMDHDFIGLAAQLYTVYENMKTLKADYLKQYRIHYGSARNPFGDNDDDLYFKSEGEVDNLFGTSVTKGKKGSSFVTPYGPSPFPTSDISVTSNSTIGGTEKTTVVPSTSVISSSNPQLGQQFGASTLSSQPASSFLGQSGALSTATSNANVASSTGLVKPTFGFSSTTTSLPLFGQTSGIGSLGGSGLTNTIAGGSIGDSLFGKRLAS